ncbi:hypothetical protein ABD74_17005 [Brevibacillus laterosporus]|nr:hypothetical protein [Brevibacillus laterosporus]
MPAFFYWYKSRTLKKWAYWLALVYFPSLHFRIIYNIPDKLLKMEGGNTMSNNKCAEKEIKKIVRTIKRFKCRLKHKRRESRKEADESNFLIQNIQILIEQALLT